MPHLIKGTTNHWIDLNQLTVDMFNFAVEETQKKRRSLTWLENFNFDETIQENLNAKLTDLLSTMDLLREDNYKNILNVIDNWQPTHTDQYKCNRIKKLLFELLPLAKQKQQLQSVCLKYKDYLKMIIENDLAEQFPEEYQLYCKPYVHLVLNTSRNYEQKAVTPRDMDFFVTHYERRLPIKDSTLKSAMEKYQLVSALQLTLQNSKSAPTQIMEFNQLFRSNRAKLEKRRDGIGTVFVKMVLTILSAGALLLAGLWSVQGARTANKVQKILDSGNNQQSLKI